MIKTGQQAIPLLNKFHDDVIIGKQVKNILAQIVANKDGGDAAKLRAEWEQVWELYSKASTINKNKPIKISQARNKLGKVAQEIAAQDGLVDQRIALFPLRLATRVLR